MLLEVDTLLDEDTGHFDKGLVGTEVLFLDLVEVVAERILGASNDSEVRAGLLFESDWHFLQSVLLKIGGILHFLEHNALLHLADVLLFDNSEELDEGVVDLGGIKLVRVSNGLL